MAIEVNDEELDEFMSKLIDEITAELGSRFNTFGGGKADPFNPVSKALQDNPLVFAMGVDVKSVVTLVTAKALKRVIVFAKEKDQVSA
jgi:hypothetical protein